MNTRYPPASAGIPLRALVATALVISVVAGAFVMPAAAIDTSHPCCHYTPDGKGPYCVMCPNPVPTIEPPLLPCCYKTADGRVFCMGFGRCTTEPILLNGQES